MTKPDCLERDGIGRTLLHQAVLKGEWEPFAHVLAHCSGAVTDVHGLSVLEYAAWKGRERMVDALLKHDDVRRDINKMDDFGMSPLFKAVGFGHYRIAKLLIDKGKADVNLRQGVIRAPAEYGATSFHDTPLHLCGRKRDPIMGRLLVAYGADVHATNGEGKTPLQVTVETKSPSYPLATLLIEAGADWECARSSAPWLMRMAMSTGTLRKFSAFREATGHEGRR